MIILFFSILISAIGGYFIGYNHFLNIYLNDKEFREILEKYLDEEE